MLQISACMTLLPLVDEKQIFDFEMPLYYSDKAALI